MLKTEVSSPWTVKVFIKLGIRLNLGFEMLRECANCGLCYQPASGFANALTPLAINGA